MMSDVSRCFGMCKVCNTRARLLEVYEICALSVCPTSQTSVIQLHCQKLQRDEFVVHLFLVLWFQFNAGDLSAQHRLPSSPCYGYSKFRTGITKLLVIAVIIVRGRSALLSEAKQLRSTDESPPSAPSAPRLPHERSTSF
jgi:hypothetical protein